MILILWPLFALIVGAVFGAARTIGFWGGFLVSLVFSPVIGLFICLFFKTNEDDARQKQMLNQQQQIANSLRNNSPVNISNELQNLAELKEKGHLTDDEFIKAKQKLFD